MMKSKRMLSLVFGSALALLTARSAMPAEPASSPAQAVEKLEAAAGKIASDFEKAGETVTGRLEQRASAVITVPLEQARCYTFIVAGGPGVADLSLSVRVQGKEVAGQRTAGDVLVVEWCSPASLFAAIKLTLFKGSGDFALGVYGSKKSDAGTGQQVGGGGNDFMANRIRQLHGQFGRNRNAASPVFKGNLDTGKEQLFKIGLQAGHCYTIIAAGSPSVRSLNLYLIDENDREILSNSAPGSFLALDTDPCIGTSGPYRVKIKMFSGYGQFGLQLFSD